MPPAHAQQCDAYLMHIPGGNMRPRILRSVGGALERARGVELALLHIIVVLALKKRRQLVARGLHEQLRCPAGICAARSAPPAPHGATLGGTPCRLGAAAAELSPRPCRAWFIRISVSGLYARRVHIESVKGDVGGWLVGLLEGGRIYTCTYTLCIRTQTHTSVL